MSGLRENLSKAVVLASVTAAHKQGRDCRIVSFSSTSNSVECENIPCDAGGISRLLEFLSYSFGGGTDVTGALKHAMDVLESDLTSSDILLVSDGELPNPPVSKSTLAKLEELKRQTGMEIHGLLIGKRESESLNMLCSEVHDFLGSYDGINAVTSSYTGLRRRSTSALSLLSSMRIVQPFKSPSLLRRTTREYSVMPLRAMSHSDCESDSRKNSHMKLRKRVDGAKTKRRRFDDDDDNWDLGGDESVDWKQSGSNNANEGFRAHENSVDKSEFVQRVEEALELIQDTASKEVERSKLAMPEPELRWSKSEVISDTIFYVERDLVERDLEARLVVLGVISKEHVLFIGPPGTSSEYTFLIKCCNLTHVAFTNTSFSYVESEIGRRLSHLCGGPFFQRLFTRFTTPEEIFGPLSLRALENDEYVRYVK